MKKSIALLVAMYLFLLVPIGLVQLLAFLTGKGTGSFEEVLIIAGLVLLLLLLAAGIATVVFAVRLLKRGDYNGLRSNMAAAKLGSIPFFLALALFVAWFQLSPRPAPTSAGLLVFFFWTFIELLFFLFVFVSIIFLYIMLLLSSAYGIAYVVMLRKQNAISTVAAVFFILLQLLPIADVIVTIVLLTKHKKRTTPPAAYGGYAPTSPV